MPLMGFFDLSDRYASLDAKKDPLVEINAVLPWEEFRPVLERVWRKPEGDRKSRAGRKSIDAVVMFKALVLSALYNLSDGQIEYQVRDRLSFMRFLGLGLGDRVPDARTVWLYREALAQAGKVEEVFGLLDGHLARQGYIARGGQMLDVERACATGSSMPARDRAGPAQPQKTRGKHGDQGRARRRRVGLMSPQSGARRMWTHAGARIGKPSGGRFSRRASTASHTTAPRTTSTWTGCTSWCGATMSPTPPCTTARWWTRC